MSNDNLYTEDQLLSIASYTAYLTSGYDGGKVEQVIRVLEDGTDKTPAFQEEHGHTGAVYRLAQLAVIAFREIDEEWIKRKDGFPGVVHYEIMEPMGKWFRENSMCSDIAFLNELKRTMEQWFNDYPL
jgi:hypothetical protein